MVVISKNVPLVMFIIAISLGIFTYGVIVGKYEITPYQYMNFMKDSFIQVYKEAGMLTKTKPTDHLYQSRYKGEGIVHYDKALAVPGFTLIAAFFDNNLEIRLITLEGDVVNKWPINIFDIWEDFQHIQPQENRPTTNWNSKLNGVMLLPDGSVVFNLFGVIKMDRCGNVQWKVPYHAHHSLESAADGGYWVCGKRYIGAESKHPPIKAPYEEDTIMKISSSGAVVKEISILDIFWKNNLFGILFSNNRSFDPNPELDVVHLNDVEELTIELADSFPLFEAGDLLVSIREPNMIMVLDPHTELVKWYQVGPWIQQHDADFQADGTITVFDNAYDNTRDGALFGGSKIVRVDPSNRWTDVLYGELDHEIMYTATEGDHQLFENGNILMAEAESGRVIEVDNSGKIVWEFINRYSDNEVFRVSDAIRYPKNYFTVKNWSCK